MKIGVFDSGLGGLTIVKSIIDNIKGSEIFYIADTKNAPYGDKTPSQILEYSRNITQHLINNHNIDILILACNTATAHSIDDLRKSYPSIIIIGTEPGIKPAIKNTITGKIGVLATSATLEGLKYQNLIHKLTLDKNVVIYEQSCPGLVEQIEKGDINNPYTNKLLESWLLPMRDNNVDTIVLGCTHYPLVSSNIKSIMNNNVSLIHTGNAISNHLFQLSSSLGHINIGDINTNIFTTGDINTNIIYHIFNDILPIKKIVI